MEQNNQKLTTEISKLIANTIAAEGYVALPEVGTLSIETANNKIRKVLFSAEVGERTLVAVIAEQGNCSAEQAQQIYSKWLDEVRKGDAVSIVGIGEIKNGSFSISPKMANKLKPSQEQEPQQEPQPQQAPTQPVEKEPRSFAKIWIVGAVVIVAIIAGVLIFGVSNDKTTDSGLMTLPEYDSAPVVEPLPEPDAVEEELQEPTVSYTKLTSKARFVSSADAREALQRTLQSSTDPKRFRVVCGVLLSEANAGRLILDIEERTGDDVVCTAYVRNGGYMVAMYESEHFYTSLSYLRCEAKPLYDTAWLYDEQKTK